MKFLIFGGTGFVGQNLHQFLKKKGEEAVSASRSGKGNSLLVDITKESDFEKIDYNPDVIINCASSIPVKGKTSSDPDYLKELFLTNVVGAINITNWAVNLKVPLIINCSTLVVVKKPWPSPLEEGHSEPPEGFHVGYAMSKLSQEQIMSQAVRGTETNLVHVRLSAVYGGRMTPDGIIFNLLQKLALDKEITLTNAHKNFVDLIHVKDVCRALYALSLSKIEERVMNLASGQEISIFELAQALKKITGSNSPITNKETYSINSRANIAVNKLKMNIGSVYNQFLSLEDGLKETVQKHQPS